MVPKSASVSPYGTLEVSGIPKKLWNKNNHQESISMSIWCFDFFYLYADRPVSRFHQTVRVWKSSHFLWFVPYIRSIFHGSWRVSIWWEQPRIVCGVRFSKTYMGKETFERPMDNNKGVLGVGGQAWGFQVLLWVLEVLASPQIMEIEGVRCS